MKKQTQLLLGSVLIGFGLLLLVSNLFDIDFGIICWPSLLILIGVFILVRPRIAPEGSDVIIRFVGDLNRAGAWEVRGQEIWSFVGDVNLDFSKASVPAEEVAYRITSFVGDAVIIVPEDIGLSISSTAFVNEARVDGKKLGGLITPVSYTSENYESAAQRLRFEIISFVSELKVVRV